MVKWRRSGGGLSENLEDRRSMRGTAAAGAGGLGILGVILAALFGGGGGGSLADVFGQVQGAGGAQRQVDPAEEPLVEEMSFALDDIQEFWGSEDGLGDAYQEAQLVLFTDAVSTQGCGNAPAQVGPFYCPADANAYIDLSFFQELDRRYGAPGDFARVYVLAHELGHHVQNVQGISDQVRQLQQQNPGRANELSIRVELQADCYAGVWGNSAQDRGMLEPGDLEGGLRAAAAVGDDTMQQRAGGRVNQESWSHGSAESRQRWFLTGFEAGDHRACDTFSTPANQL